MMNEFIKRVLTSIVLVVCFGGAYLHSSLLFSFTLTVVFLLIVLFEWPKLIGGNFGVWFWLISAIYPGLPIGALILLNHSYRNANILLPLYPILIAWTADTFGYLVGRIIGKHKICPSISPGKSWEGLIASCGGVFILNSFIMPHFAIAPFSAYGNNYKILAVISVLQTIIAFLGGIFISFLKRRKGLKDTGSVLPGHGGFLDRFDSVFFAVIAVWGIIGTASIHRLSFYKKRQVASNLEKAGAIGKAENHTNKSNVSK